MSGFRLKRPLVRDAATRRDLALASLVVGAVLLTIALFPLIGGTGSVELPANDYSARREQFDCPPENRIMIGTIETCTHGPDPAPVGYRIDDPVDPLPPQMAVQSDPIPAWCIGDGTSGKRIHIMYVRGQSTASAYADYLASFRTWGDEIDQLYSANAAATGEDRHLRYVHDGNCVLDIPEVVIPDAAMGNFLSFVNAVATELGNMGIPIGPDRQILTYADATDLCGIGTWHGDERKNPDRNEYNQGNGLARIDRGCWGSPVAAHELGHTLGAVNLGAPHSTGYGHCYEEYDLMCYIDGPNSPSLVYNCPDAADEYNVFDCNYDDYYNTNPTPNSYLDNYWNIADSDFLIAATLTATPEGSPQASPVTGTPADTPTPN